MNNELNLLNTYRRNLQILQAQKARFGVGETPLHILNSIQETKRSIIEYETQLRRRLHDLQLKQATYGLVVKHG